MRALAAKQEGLYTGELSSEKDDYIGGAVVVVKEVRVLTPHCMVAVNLKVESGF
jgi:hypothetical protein